MTDGDGGSLREDPRWRRLHDASWTCSSCGVSHGGLPDLVCGKPEPWPDGEEKVANSAVRRSEHFLSDDFCVLEGEHFFVRCVLEIPIVGGEGERFAFGVWSSLSRANFRRYVDSFDEGDQEGLGPWFGWFSNRLKGYPDTLFLRCQVHPRGGGRRPWIELDELDHPLVREQRAGMTLDRLLELHALNGHDFRESLLD